MYHSHVELVTTDGAVETSENGKIRLRTSPMGRLGGIPPSIIKLGIK
jgi:hypothetical protein